MVSIPTSIFGILAFMIFAVTIYSVMDSSASHVAQTSDQLTSDFTKISNAGNTTGQSDSWYASIISIGNIIYYGFSIVVETVELPFNMFADMIIMLGILPADLKFVGVLIGVGILTAIAVYIRGFR